MDEWETLITSINLCHSDPNKLIFQLQQKILEHYKYIYDEYQKLKQNTSNKNIVILVERSALSAVFVFCKMYLNKRQLSENQYNVLLDQAKKYELQYDRRIFLDVTAKQCQIRIIKRNRKCDCNTSIHTLQILDGLYKQMYTINQPDKHEMNNQRSKLIKNITIINGMFGNETVAQNVIRILADITKDLKRKSVNTLYNYAKCNKSK